MTVLFEVISILFEILFPFLLGGAGLGLFNWPGAFAGFLLGTILKAFYRGYRCQPYLKDAAFEATVWIGDALFPLVLFGAILGFLAGSELNPNFGSFLGLLIGPLLYYCAHLLFAFSGILTSQRFRQK